MSDGSQDRFESFVVSSAGSFLILFNFVRINKDSCFSLCEVRV